MSCNPATKYEAEPGVCGTVQLCEARSPADKYLTPFLVQPSKPPTVSFDRHLVRFTCGPLSTAERHVYRPHNGLDAERAQPSGSLGWQNWQLQRQRSCLYLKAGCSYQHQSCPYERF